MWAILKFDKKNFHLLKNDLKEKLGDDVQFYSPKLRLKKFLKKKICFKEINLLGDYLFCFHKDFSKMSVLDSLKYSKGLKYFLTDFLKSQIDIKKFILRCKENEDENGFIKSTFFNYKLTKKFELISGPLTNLIFNVVEENKKFVESYIGNYKVTVSKEENLFRPV